LAAPAHAAFPGNNGKLVFASDRDDPNPGSCSPCNYEIYTMNPDGTGVTRLTNTTTEEATPTWSPDGQKIAYTRSGEIWVMGADGSGQSPLKYFGSGPGAPAWSPDGRKIAFGMHCHCDGDGLVIMNADGTGENTIVPTSEGELVGITAWSPEGSRIVFVMAHDNVSFSDIFTVNSDGTGLGQITNGGGVGGVDWSPDASKILFDRGGINTAYPDGTSQTTIASGYSPSWSPDQRKIVYSSGSISTEIRVMNSDGTNQIQLTSNSANDRYPDWQPIRPAGYARPKNATPNSIRLVPAFNQCTSANASHGAPLSVASCSPPQESSNYLTVGTPDANGQPANSVGLLTTKVLTEAPIDLTNGDQSDVQLTISITDVRNKATLADYTGELRASFGLRLTDRNNGTDSVLFHPATAVDSTFGFSFPCTATGAGVGSTCSSTTSADAVASGITPEFQRAVWQLGQVQIYDGGSDGDGDTTGDNTLFMTQGLFAP
jgi:TolB protein